MPRVYKSKTSKPYKKYDPFILKTAVDAYVTGNTSLGEVARQYNIAKSVLHRHATRKVKCPGGQRCLSDEEEKYIIKFINICSERGYLLDDNSLRTIIKQYLDTSCKQIKKFPNNLPSIDYAKLFFKRHIKEIPEKINQNKKRRRAKISLQTTQIIQDFFKEYMNKEKAPTSFLDIDNVDNKDDIDVAVLSLLKEMSYGKDTSTCDNVEVVNSEEEINFIHNTSSSKVFDSELEQQQKSIENNSAIESKPSIANTRSFVYVEDNTDNNDEKSPKNPKYSSVFINNPRVKQANKIGGLQGPADFDMARKYKSKSSKPYKKYDPLLLKTAINAYKTENKPLAKIANQYNISKSVLYRHATQKMKCQGGQPCLSKEEEKYIVKFINICSERGYLLDNNCLRTIIKQYLDTSCKQIKKFSNNLPSMDYAKMFFKRHIKEMPKKLIQFKKKSRAKISSKTTELIQDYFKEYMNTEKVPLSSPANDADDNENDDVDEAVLFLLRQMGYGQATSTFNYVKAAKSKEDIDCIPRSGSSEGLNNESEHREIPIEINKIDTKTKNSTYELTSLVYRRSKVVKNIGQVSEKQQTGSIFINTPEVIKAKQSGRQQGSLDQCSTNKNMPIVHEDHILVSKNIAVQSSEDRIEIPVSFEKQSEEEDKIVFIVI